MAITKNKIELLDKSISVELEMELDYYNNYWSYYYEDYYYPEEYDDDGGCWGYIPTENLFMVINSYRGGCKTINKSPNIGSLIDMNTIYPKHILREKKINQLLGLEYYNMYKPTLAEIFPKIKDIDED